MLGPNGAGKSTLLAILAGIAAPRPRRAELDGGCCSTSDGRSGRWQLAARRGAGLALLAQDPLLFPHLTVLDNVAFGPRPRA